MDKFYIIQSLRAADPELGKRVYDNIKDLTRAEYFKVTTKDELLNILDLIRVDLMASPNARGVIHIHCHGNDEGIGIRDDNDKRDFVCYNSTRLFEIATEGYKQQQVSPEKVKARRAALERVIVNHFGFMNEEQKRFLDYALSGKGTDDYLERFRTIFFS